MKKRSNAGERHGRGQGCIIGKMAKSVYALMTGTCRGRTAGRIDAGYTTTIGRCLSGEKLPGFGQTDRFLAVPIRWYVEIPEHI